jgi:hypothetical protein
MSSDINTKSNRPTLREILGLLVKEVPLEVPADAKVQVGDEVLSREQLVGVFQTALDALDANDASRRTRRRAVEAEKAAVAHARLARDDLRTYAAANLGGTKGASYLALGFTPRKPGVATPEAKTLGIARAKATRKARNTLGKNQKAQIRGEVTQVIVTDTAAVPVPATPVAPTTPAAPPAPSGDAKKS